MALAEIDVLVAQALGLTLDELLLVYRYSSRSCSSTSATPGTTCMAVSSYHQQGSGRRRPAAQGRHRATQSTLHAARCTMREGQFGWDDVQPLPDGTVVQQWVQDDTLPTGPYLKERRWLAPFARASREEDYASPGRFLRPQAAIQTIAKHSLQGSSMLPSLLAHHMPCHMLRCSALCYSFLIRNCRVSFL